MIKQTTLSAWNSASYGENCDLNTCLCKIHKKNRKVSKNHEWGFTEDCAVYKRICLEKSMGKLQKWVVWKDNRTRNKTYLLKIKYKRLLRGLKP